MSNRLSQDKARAIAVEYCSNGRKRRNALKTVGYAKTYAESGLGMKLYDNILVKAEIERIDNKIEVIADFTREQSLLELEEARIIAKGKFDASAMVSATRGKNKLYGLDIDKSITIDLTAGRRPPDADEAKQRNLERVRAIEGS